MEELFALCEHTGISGYEFEIGKHIKDILTPICDAVETDPIGNVIGVLNKGGKIKIMIEAHMDEIGFMVKSIDENGFVMFEPVCRIDTSVLPACEVVIHGKKPVSGVVGAKPPHLQSADDRKNKYEIDQLYIDTGYNYNQLSKLVTPGDIISFNVTPVSLLNGCFASKSVDNRMGVYVVIECLKRLKDKNIDAEIVGLCAVQEEVGCRGAKVGAYTVDPDFSFVVDVTHGRSPLVGEEHGFMLKSGVAVGIGPNLHTKLTGNFIEAMKANKIPYTIEVCPGDSGTDAGPIQISKKGVPCILASVPLRYMHTTVETANMQDIIWTAEAICAMIESGGYNC